MKILNYPARNYHNFITVWQYEGLSKSVGSKTKPAYKSSNCVGVFKIIKKSK